MKRFWSRAALLLMLVIGVPACAGALRPGATAASGSCGSTFLAAAIQAQSTLGSPEKNRARLAGLVREAASNGARVIVLPETAITGYMTPDLKTAWQVPGRPISEGLQGRDPAPHAETVPGPSTDAFGELAAQYHAYITVPLLELDPKSGTLYNTSVLVGPDGKILLQYRKRNPWPYAEKGWASPGDLGNPYADTPYGRLSMIICYDINYEPERLRALHVDHVLYPIAWVDMKNSDWFTQGLPALAKECGFSIIGANWAIPAGLNPEWVDNGRSVIIDRTGALLVSTRATDGARILYASLPVP